MGLDMYLERMPRYKDATPRDIGTVEDFLDWEKAKAEGSEYAKGTFKDWCGRENWPPHEYIDIYKPFYRIQFAYWDTGREYGRHSIIEQVGYWRKANAIHKWFVDNIQDGVDDCCYHREVTKEDLEELRDICHEVLCNPDVAEDRLPTQSGFFFGGTGYGEWYMDDIRTTIEIVTQVLQTTDFDKEMLFYVSSW
jgi:hypothetical protein